MDMGMLVDLSDRREREALKEYRSKRILAIINKTIENLEPFEDLNGIKLITDQLSPYIETLEEV